MRSTILAIAGLAVAAYGQPEPETAVLKQENAIVETPTPSLAIDGW
jgi:hypothetical protein